MTSMTGMITEVRQTKWEQEGNTWWQCQKKYLVGKKTKPFKTATKKTKRMIIKRWH